MKNEQNHPLVLDPETRAEAKRLYKGRSRELTKSLVRLVLIAIGFIATANILGALIGGAIGGVTRAAGYIVLVPVVFAAFKPTARLSEYTSQIKSLAERLGVSPKELLIAYRPVPSSFWIAAVLTVVWQVSWWGYNLFMLISTGFIFIFTYKYDWDLGIDLISGPRVGGIICYAVFILELLAGIFCIRTIRKRKRPSHKAGVFAKILAAILIIASLSTLVSVIGIGIIGGGFFK